MSHFFSNHEVVASVGGKPKPKVQMLFRDPTGRPLKAAKFGDPVGLYLMLSPDSKSFGRFVAETIINIFRRLQSHQSEALHVF